MAVSNVLPLNPPKGVKGAPQQAQISESYLSSHISLGRWTPEGVRYAIDSHREGRFDTSFALWETIFSEPQVLSTVQVRANAFASRSGLPFSVVPSMGVDDRRAVAVAKTMEDNWWDCMPTAEVVAFQRDAIGGGIAVGRAELQWLNGDWMPRFRRLRPQGLEWSDHEEKFFYTDRKGERHHVTPGQNGWVLHLPNGGDSWLLGAIIALAIPALARTLTLADWLNFTNRHANPAMKIFEPFNHTADVEKNAGSEGADTSGFYNQLKKLRQRGLIRLPQGSSKDVPGWDAEWMELKSTSHDGFDKLLTIARKDIAAVLLGHDTETSSSVGGDGASLLERVSSEFLASDAEGLQNTFRAQVWMPWVIRSIDASRPQLAGWPNWDVRPKTDLSARATMLNALGDALGKLAAQGVETKPIVEEFGLVQGKKPKPVVTAAPAPEPKAEPQAQPEE